MARPVLQTHSRYLGIRSGAHTQNEIVVFCGETEPENYFPRKFNDLVLLSVGDSLTHAPAASKDGGGIEMITLRSPSSTSPRQRWACMHACRWDSTVPGFTSPPSSSPISPRRSENRQAKKMPIFPPEGWRQPSGPSWLYRPRKVHLSRWILEYCAAQYTNVLCAVQHWAESLPRKN